MRITIGISRRILKAGKQEGLTSALQTGREQSLPLPATTQTADMMDALLDQGKGDLDHSVLPLLAEQLGGVWRLKINEPG